MQNLSAFQEVKQQILNCYEKILNSDYIPVVTNGQKIDSQLVNEWRGHLEHEKFIVSVCGQVKAGKSTFLNALIFQDEILPSASTPETAKITIIKYGEHPKAKIYFYTDDEWKELQKDNYYQEYIEPEIEKRMEKGEISLEAEQKFIGATDEIEDLGLLKEYVAKDGKYTPFVSWIEIEYPAEILKEIEIVDTPGIDDPNPVRSEVTKNWISKSDAVIYLLYAGQAFTNTDYDFINNYLFQIPPEKIIIVISKIDTLQNKSSINSVINYVQNTIKQKLGEMGEVIFANKTLFPVAPLFYLYQIIYQKYNGNLPQKKLQDIQYQLQERPMGNSFLQNIIQQSGKLLEDVRKAIEKHLIAGKGTGIINSHIEKIKSIKQANLTKLLEEESKIEAKDESLMLEKEKREEKLREIKKTAEELNSIHEEIQGKMRSELNRVVNNISNITDKRLKDARKEVLNEINKDREDIENFIKIDLRWVMKDILMNTFLERLWKDIQKETGNFAKQAKMIWEEEVNKKLQNTLEGFELTQKRIELIIAEQIIDTTEIKRMINETIDEILREDQLPELIEKFLFFFVDEDKTIANLSQKVNRLFSEIENKIYQTSLYQKIAQKYNEKITQTIRKIENVFNDLLKEFEKTKKEIEEIEGRLEELREEVARAKEEMAKRRARLEAFFGECLPEGTLKAA